MSLLHQKFLNHESDSYFLSQPIKKDPENGIVPVYMRICYQRQKTESRLFVEIP